MVSKLNVQQKASIEDEVLTNQVDKIFALWISDSLCLQSSQCLLNGPMKKVMAVVEIEVTCKLSSTDLPLLRLWLTLLPSAVLLHAKTNTKSQDGIISPGKQPELWCHSDCTGPPSKWGEEGKEIHLSWNWPIF